jgi:septal ring factor EnvC (AmiA/AmiB activator)
MNPPIETAVTAELPIARASKSSASVKPKRRTYMMLLAGWLVLIGIGVTGAKLYTDHLKAQIAKDIAAQTEQQLKSVQDDYRKQVASLKESMSSDMSQLQTKVDTLNELLSFVKDSASSKTDNSNQLYTQLGDVKKKLDELKSNLDMLK